MLFTEIRFAVFFVICLSVYWTLKRTSHRHVFLLVMSYIFYAGWDVRFLALIAYSTAVTYIGSHLLRDAPSAQRRRLVLIVTIVMQLASLFFFKYFDFAFENVAALLAATGLSGNWSAPDILLPVGISFFTFQAISYLVDVSRGDTQVRSGLRDVALYIAFFPQLVAGPIVRSTDFMPQLDEDKRRNTVQFIRGFSVFLLGFCYKAAIADNLGLLVGPVFADPLDWSVVSVWVATLGFYGQIYFDFAGYSWMAIGVAGMLGFALPRNFNFPYVARNVQEFWHRWHISLSTWLRDYLYIPLGGNRMGAGRTYVNLALVMLLGGLWHGAAWNFAIWGGIHGGMLALERLMGKKALHARLPRPIAVAMTFFVVCIAWVFFRAASLPEAVNYLGAMFAQSGDHPAADMVPGQIYSLYHLGTLILAAIIIWGAPQTWDYTRQLTWPKTIAIVVLFVLAIALLGATSFHPFIYFIF